MPLPLQTEQTEHLLKAAKMMSSDKNIIKVGTETPIATNIRIFMFYSTKILELGRILSKIYLRINPSFPSNNANIIGLCCKPRD